MIRKIAGIAICLFAVAGVGLAWKVHQNRQANARDARALLARAETGDAAAQYRLARLYYYGQGVRQDYTEAFRWSRKAADRGNVAAEYAMGVCYFEGKGVARDEVEAIRWYRRAANQKYALAEGAMGYVYFSGRGVERDYSEAARWYRLAAERGDRVSQSALAYLYHTGQGVPQSETESQAWYRKAAESAPQASAVLRFLNREPKPQSTLIWQIVAVTLAAMLLAIAPKAAGARAGGVFKRMLSLTIGFLPVKRHRARGPSCQVIQNGRPSNTKKPPSMPSVEKHSRG